MSYRDATAAVAAEAAVLAAERRAEIAGLQGDLVDLYVNRASRIALGVTGTLAAAAAVAGMLAGVRGCGWFLIGGWAAALLVYLVTRKVAPGILRSRLSRCLSRCLAPGGDPIRAAAALRALDVRHRAFAIATRHRHASHAWPLVAATLLGPHTLHLVVGEIASLGRLSVAGFDGWMKATAMMSPHVFAYGVYTAWRFPRDRFLACRVVIATALSLVPGVLVFGVPSLVVVLSAAAIALAAYLPMGAIIDAETLVELRIRPTARE